MKAMISHRGHEGHKGKEDLNLNSEVDLEFGLSSDLASRSSSQESGARSQEGGWRQNKECVVLIGTYRDAEFLASIAS